MDRLKAVGYALGFIALAPILFVALTYIFVAEALEKRQLRRKFERAALPSPRSAKFSSPPPTYDR